MADHMGEKVREILSRIIELPKDDDHVAVSAVETTVLSEMGEQGYTRIDIEQQLGRIPEIIAAEILRRRSSDHP